MRSAALTVDLKIEFGVDSRLEEFGVDGRRDEFGVDSIDLNRIP